jgi:hypothetical protein
MNLLIDDVARVLATPMSRRKAFARIAGILGGALLASVPAQAAPGNCTTCQNNNQCTSNNCASCTGGVKICCPVGFVCCGTAHCCPSNSCCNDNGGTCFTSNNCNVGGC